MYCNVLYWIDHNWKGRKALSILYLPILSMDCSLTIYTIHNTTQPSSQLQSRWTVEDWMNECSEREKNTKLVKIVIPFSTPSIRYYHFNHVEFGILRSFPFFPCSSASFRFVSNAENEQKNRWQQSTKFLQPNLHINEEKPFSWVFFCCEFFLFIPRTMCTFFMCGSVRLKDSRASPKQYTQNSQQQTISMPFLRSYQKKVVLW